MEHAVPPAVLSGTPEVIFDGDSGLLVEHGEVDGLVAAMERILTDESFSHKLGDGGRRRVLAHFTYPVFRSRLAEALDRLVTPHRSSPVSSLNIRL